MEDRLCARPRAGGRDLDEGAGEQPGLPLEAHDRGAVQTLEDPIKDPGLRPAVQPGVEGGQVPKRAGNPRPLPPCAATDQRAGRTGRGERRTGPRGTGRRGALRAYGACGRSLQPGDQKHAHEWEQALAKQGPPSRAHMTPRKP